ncbi:ATP-dependent zinc metalloprotease FtsH [Patescibacteria group bacterium]|nr:ATP-dependent zinc metalloprotease FtsH [Patescibacteria group bacterium]MBU1890457.1 ATP-dependent zinc metalloprotease FtsH [Patescibacteria group bacterium]
MGKAIKNLFIFIVVFLVIGGLFSLYQTSTKEVDEISLNKLVEQVENSEVKQIIVDGNKLEIILNDDTKQTTNKENEESLSQILKNYGVSEGRIRDLNVEIRGESSTAFWLGSILPFLLPLLLIGGFIYFMLRQVQGSNNRAMSFGQSKARNEKKTTLKNQIKFKDVAGVKEAKEELLEVVEFLKTPKRFLSLGAKIPKGVLLVGPPGTGKTLIARAVSGEANVPFFHISGSEFVEMFVGVGASRVRDLFKQAKSTAPCIVFIDEIDAVGRQRGSGLGGSHDEREQTLNQILVEMDGFDTNTNVIIIAATNRPDVLDPALLRPGRFDRRVMLDMPDIGDREEILKVHAIGKPFDSGIDLRRLAERTPGFSGADLSNLLNEAAILAARRDKKKIFMDDCLDSIDKVLLGPERKSHILNEKEKKIAAYHEAGHAVVAHLLPNADPIRKVSIMSRGSAAGYTLKLPSEDRHMHSKSYFFDEITVLLAGHVTEKIFFKEVTTGASNDLKEATRLAKELTTRYGMSEALGPRTYGQPEEMIFLGKEIHEKRDYSNDTASMIDKEIMKVIRSCYSRAKNMVIKARPKVTEVANLLLEKETIEQKEFRELFD